MTLEVDVLYSQIIDLRVLGDERDRLRDERGDQGGAENKGAARFAQNFVYAFHNIPHAL
ncbi:hypothetical protein [Streptomyces olivochromogenes]|uniref:hypothetical protein n=1 Tax=Streptomyces olivochromogenes TaxID=1963 RepID=UPI001F3B4507|nr:hypothetical protein [Streptomyces olivochromogenes]